MRGNGVEVFKEYVSVVKADAGIGKKHKGAKKSGYACCVIQKPLI